MAAPIGYGTIDASHCGASRRGPGTHQAVLLALAATMVSRTDALRIGGVGPDHSRLWLRFNARGTDGLVDGKSPGAPSKLNAEPPRTGRGC